MGSDGRDNFAWRFFVVGGWFVDEFSTGVVFGVLWGDCLEDGCLMGGRKGIV